MTDKSTSESLRAGAEALAPQPEKVQEPCADAHTWSNQFGDDWTPERGTPCDCGKKRWLIQLAAEALAPPAPGWQPIETCPRDVTRALLLYPAFKLADGELTTEPAGDPLVTMGYRNVGGGWEEIDPTLEATGEFFGDDWEYGEPTRWHPMPAPPRAEAREARQVEQAETTEEDGSR